MFPFAQWEEMGKQNMAMFERAMQMFTPFAANGGGEEPAAAEAETGEDDDLSALRAQLKTLQEQVDSLSRTRRPSKQKDDG